MRWAILGAGGVGSYSGGRLAAAGQDVTLVARGEHLAALRRDGLRMEDPDGRVEIFPIRATGDTVEVGQVDVVLLGVKTWQLAGALPALRPLISAGTVVVTAQNGVEAPEEVAATVGRDAVVPGMVKIFANLDGPGRVRHVGGPASLTFGEWDGGSSQRVATIRAELADAGITAIATDDVWMQLWSKFLFVVPFGGLGTLLDLPIGELRAGPRTRRLLADCMQEIQGVAAAEGVRLPSDVVPATLAFIDQQPADGISSLHRDNQAGRPSELEAWTGAVVRRGARTGVATPLHDLVYEALGQRAARLAHAP